MIASSRIIIRTMAQSVSWCRSLMTRRNVSINNWGLYWMSLPKGDTASRIKQAIAAGMAQPLDLVFDLVTSEMLSKDQKSSEEAALCEAYLVAATKQIADTNYYFRTRMTRCTR